MLSDSQNLNTYEERIQQDTDNFILSIFKVLGHGLIVLIGLVLFSIYFIYMGINLSWGNYIIFIPLLMVLLTPFVVIILGAMNSYSVRYIFNRKPNDSWSSLLIEGIIAIFIGNVFAIVWSILIIYFFRPLWPPFYFNFGWFFIMFSLLLIMSLGYTTKEITIVLFARNKNPRKKSTSEES